MMSFNSHNLWYGNYWYRPRILPKLISVVHMSFSNPFISFWTFDIDFRPARKPNDTPETSTNIYIIEDGNHEVFNQITTSSGYSRLNIFLDKF
jgi:hypothetical protein